MRPKQMLTSLAGVLLLGAVWPLVGAAAIAAVIPSSQRLFGWALLAFVIVVSLARPLPFIDLAGAVAATALLIGAEVAQKLAGGGRLADLTLAMLFVPALLLLATPWVMRVLTVELDGLVLRVRQQEEEIVHLTRRSETGVYSRWVLESDVDEEIERSRRYSRSVTLGILAVDEWEELSEDLSPAQLDAVRHRIEGDSVRSLRPMDRVIVLGEGQWLVMFPETSAEGAAIAAERLLAALTRDAGVRLRIGLADFPRDGVLRDELIAEAGQALEFARTLKLTIADRRLLSGGASG